MLSYGSSWERTIAYFGARFLAGWVSSEPNAVIPTHAGMIKKTPTRQEWGFLTSPHKGRFRAASYCCPFFSCSRWRPAAFWVSDSHISATAIGLEGHAVHTAFTVAGKGGGKISMRPSLFVFRYHYLNSNRIALSRGGAKFGCFITLVGSREKLCVSPFSHAAPAHSRAKLAARTRISFQERRTTSFSQLPGGVTVFSWYFHLFSRPFFLTLTRAKVHRYFDRIVLLLVWNPK